MIDGAHIGVLFRRHVRVFEKTGHADNPVHGRTNFVAHRRQEARLRSASFFGLIARFFERQIRPPRTRHIAAGDLNLHLDPRPRNPLLAPGNPARALGGGDQLRRFVACLPMVAHFRISCVTRQNFGLEPASENAVGLDTKYAREGLIDKREASFEVTPQYDVVLSIENGTQTLLVFGELPMHVFELLDAANHVLAEISRGLPLGVVRTGLQSPEARGHNGGNK